MPWRKDPRLIKLCVMGGNFELFPLVAALAWGMVCLVLNETSPFCCAWKTFRLH